MIRLPSASRTHSEGTPLPLGKILRQPGFMVAVSAAMVGYGVMNLAMTATPLAMESAEHHFHHVSMTIQWHVVAMFLPSFFTGHLAARFGARQVIVAGSLLLVASALVTQWDIGWAGFNVALVLLGLGWNFTFLPATGLLTESYRPVDKARTQAANEFLVFGTAAITALLAGPLVSSLGWATLNLVLIPIALVPLAVLVWQHRARLASA